MKNIAIFFTINFLTMMGFAQNHVSLIDSAENGNNILGVEEAYAKSVYSQIIPLVFTDTNPIADIYTREKPVCSVNIKIDEQDFLFDLDTGFYAVLTVRQEVLDKITSKTLAGLTITADGFGEEYNVPVYKLESVEIGNFRYRDCLCMEESKDFYAKGCQLYKESEVFVYNKGSAGLLGRGFFAADSCWLLDFPGGVLCEISTDLINDFYQSSLSEFIQVPMEIISTGGIVVRLMTDTGELDLMLDTGANTSFVFTEDSTSDTNSIYIPETLRYDSMKIGDVGFNVILNSPFENIDGVLGLNFLINRPILLDFKNKKVCFGPEQKHKKWKYRYLLDEQARKAVLNYFSELGITLEDIKNQEIEDNKGR